MSIEFNLRELQAGLETFDERFEMLVTAVVDRRATIAEGWMKENARWTDRTGNARQSLRAVAGHSGPSWTIDLFGGMPYQIWLETRWGGRLAIIVPALQVHGAALMSNLEGLLERLRAR